MRLSTTILPTLILLLFTTSCFLDYNDELGYGYHYVVERGENDFYITDVKHGPKGPGDNFTIGCKVEDFANGDDYLIVFQKTNVDCHIKKGEYLYDNQYWIIHKPTDKIYGPLKKEEYKRIREKLKIPASLVFDE